MKVCLCASLLCLLPADVALAQATWAYRGRLAIETVAQQANTSSPLVQPGQSAWDGSALTVASADAMWEPAARLQIAGGGVVTASGSGDTDARTRELYARVSLAPWMDVEAGKRLVRWGVGYGFAPTGVLDPARVATDPNDRLGRNEGRTLARVDLFRGPASLTVAAADGLTAARVRSVYHGVEFAFIASAHRTSKPSYGANVTHVIGDKLEWHAEALVHDDAGEASRTVSAAAGLQFTFDAGANIVVEYHRSGSGASSLFVRAMRADAERAIVPELIVIGNLDDWGVTVVPAVTWTAHARVQLYLRTTHLAGGPRSFAAFAPWSTAIAAGAAVRF